MIWRQLYALIDVRIKLSANQQLKVGKFNFYFSRIVFTLLGIASLISFVAATVGGAYFFGSFSHGRCYSIWTSAIFAFLFYWALMLVGQLQQTETISFEKLLHLPVSVKAAFLLNYLSSYFNSAVWLCGPFLFGLCIGMVVAKGAVMLKLLYATISIFIFVTAISYQLRGWIANVMRNKRLKSYAMIAIPFSMIFLIPLMTVDVKSTSFFGTIKRSLKSVFENGPGNATIFGLLGLAAGSLYFSYRSIVKNHFENSNQARTSGTKKVAPARISKWMFRKLPLVSNEASVIAVATNKSLLRSPEVLAALVPLGVLAFFGSPYLFQFSGYNISEMIRPWVPLVVLIVTMLGFPAFLFSLFSYDRDGFRAFLLSPVQRKNILLGKNIAIGILTLIAGLVPLLLCQIWLPNRIPTFIANIIQIPTCFLLLCVIGNFLSVFFPVGLKRGNMQPTNAPILSMILLYVGVLIGPMIAVQPASIAFSIALLYAGSLTEPDAWVYLLLSLAQLIGAVVVYFVSIRLLGDALWVRQTDIIQAVANLPE